MHLVELFRRGQETGVKAENVPMLTIIAGQAIKPRDYLSEEAETAISPQASLEHLTFLCGYIAGLDEFTNQHQIAASEVSPYNHPELLLRKGVLTGYIHSLSGKPLDEPRTYREWYFRSMIMKGCFDELRSKTGDHLLREAKDLRLDLVGGQRFGIVVRVARDFGYTLPSEETPLDEVEFYTLAAGLDANPRRITDMFGEKIYIAGLKAWLVRKGLNNINVEEIRHPALLASFKSGLAGNPWIFTGNIHRNLTQGITSQEAYNAYMLGFTSNPLNQKR